MTLFSNHNFSIIRCKHLNILRRKTPWELVVDGKKNLHLEKVISEEARSNEQLVISAPCQYKEQGTILFYECNNILVDPDRHSELLDNYEFVREILLVLPIIKGLSSLSDLNLPLFKNEVLPNPMFTVRLTTCTDKIHTYTQPKMRHSNGWTRCYIHNTEICFPIFWMTLVHGVSCLHPKKDQCTLTVGIRKGILSLGYSISPSSV